MQGSSSAGIECLGSSIEEFEYIANAFSHPSRNQVEDGEIYNMYDQGARERHDHALVRVFRRLKHIIPCCKGRRQAISSCLFPGQASTQLTHALVTKGNCCRKRAVRLEIHTHVYRVTKLSDQKRYLSTKQHDRFKSWKLRIEGKVHDNGIISSYDKGKQAYGSPLAILSVVKKEEGIEALAKREVLQSLYSILTSYSGNPYLEQYEGFAIRLDGTRMRIGKAIVPRTYLERIRRHGSAGKDLLFLRSVEFDLADPDGRRGIARLMIALYRHIADSKQGKIIGKVSGGQDKQPSSQQMHI